MDNAIYPAQITVEETKRGDGQYPKLIVTTADGKTFSISDKHQALWPTFEGAIGKTVILIWKHPPEGATWKAFIEKAQVMITAANVQQLQQPVPQPVQSASKPVIPVAAPIPQVKEEPRYSGLTTAEWKEKDKIERSSIEAQCAFKGLVELDVAGKLDLMTHVAITQWAAGKLGINFEATKETKPKAMK